MAKPRTLSFGNFKIYLGDGESPEQFATRCGFTQKSLTINAATNDVTVPDCDDPEAPAWIERGVTSLSATVTGSGVMAMADYQTWREWMLSAASRNIRVAFDDTLANGGGYYKGAGILESLGTPVALGSEGNKVQLQVNIVSDGEWTWVDADA